MGGDKLLEQIFNLKFTAKQLNRSAIKCEKEEKAERLKVKKGGAGRWQHRGACMRMHPPSMQPCTSIWWLPRIHAPHACNCIRQHHSSHVQAASICFSCFAHVAPPWPCTAARLSPTHAESPTPLLVPPTPLTRAGMICPQPLRRAIWRAPRSMHRTRFARSMSSSTT